MWKKLWLLKLETFKVKLAIKILLKAKSFWILQITSFYKVSWFPGQEARAVKEQISETELNKLAAIKGKLQTI